MSEIIQQWYKEGLEKARAKGYSGEYADAYAQSYAEGRSLERKAIALALFTMGLDKNAVKKALRTDSEKEINSYYQDWLKDQR